jgi:DNA-binding FadR family transcriptional regulator
MSDMTRGHEGLATEEADCMYHSFIAKASHNTILYHRYSSIPIHKLVCYHIMNMWQMILMNT